MLILVNGTLGVGKTWVLRSLVHCLDDATYIEGDVLALAQQNLKSYQNRKTN